MQQFSKICHHTYDLACNRPTIDWLRSFVFIKLMDENIGSTFAEECGNDKILTKWCTAWEISVAYIGFSSGPPSDESKQLVSGVLLHSA